MTLVIVLLIAVNAFYVGAEIAVVSVGRVRARRLARTGKLGARLLAAMANDPRQMARTIAACQIGITAASLALGAWVQAALARGLEPRVSEDGARAWPLVVSLSLAAVSALQLLLGESVPKSLAVRHPERWGLTCAIPLRVSAFVVAPLIAVLNASSRGVLRLLRVPAAPHGHLHSPAEIGWLVAESARAGALRGELGDRLHDALRFTTFHARDIMVPRVRVRAIPDSITLEELRRVLWDSDHTRLPVYSGSLDNIIGVLHAKDVALRTTGVAEPPSLASLIRPLPAVPWNVRASDLLERMRKARAGMAVLLDEHGGTAGIVTLEDLIEEVLGEVEDEFDPSGLVAGRLEDGTVRLRGYDSLASVNARYGLRLRAEEARTVGGLVMEGLGRLARIGDEVEVEGGRITVEQMSGPLIDSVLVRPDGGPPGRERRG